MGKLKLGILGNGYLADIIVEAGLKGMLDEYELVGVLGRTREKTELLAKKALSNLSVGLNPLSTSS